MTKLIPFPCLPEWRAQYGEGPMFIAAASGCFDVLTPGHVRYLRKAKALGNVLIVGLNSDESIRRLKGPTRPLNTEENRVTVIAELECVDYVTVFPGDTAAEFLKAARPHVWVKGVNYTIDNLPGDEIAAAFAIDCEIVFDDVKYSKSTTEILEATEKCPRCDSPTLDGICQNYGCEGRYKTS